MIGYKIVYSYGSPQYYQQTYQSKARGRPPAQFCFLRNKKCTSKCLLVPECQDEKRRIAFPLGREVVTPVIDVYRALGPAVLNRVVWETTR